MGGWLAGRVEKQRGLFLPEAELFQSGQTEQDRAFTLTCSTQPLQIYWGFYDMTRSVRGHAAQLFPHLTLHFPQNPRACTRTSVQSVAKRAHQRALFHRVKPGVNAFIPAVTHSVFRVFLSKSTLQIKFHILSFKRRQRERVGRLTHFSPVRDPTVYTATSISPAAHQQLSAQSAHPIGSRLEHRGCHIWLAISNSQKTDPYSRENLHMKTAASIQQKQ